MNRTGDLDANQEAKVEQVAKRWAATIKKKNENALYYKDKIKYIKTKLKCGDVVEEAGSSRVQSHYNEQGVTVWSSLHLEFQDADGNKVGGEQAELDFFTFNSGGALPQVVSAKLEGSKVRKSHDRRLLRHYYEINITGSDEDLVSVLKQRFGNSPAYEKVKKVLVRYINNVDGSQGLLPLEEFRRKVPQPSDMSNVEVRGIAPDDTATLSGVEYIELGVDREPLLQRVIEIIDESLGME